MQSIAVQTHRRCEMLDVTSEVAEQVRNAGLQSGYVICYVPHTTAVIRFVWLAGLPGRFRPPSAVSTLTGAVVLVVRMRLRGPG
jgi:hypothetical protein